MNKWIQKQLQTVQGLCLTACVKHLLLKRIQSIQAAVIRSHDFLRKKSLDLNQWLKSPRFKSANPEQNDNDHIASPALAEYWRFILSCLFSQSSLVHSTLCLGKKCTDFGKLYFLQGLANFNNVKHMASACFQKWYAYSVFLVPSLLRSLFAFK